MIYIVGAGPGASEYMTPEAARVISEASVVISGGRLLETVAIAGGARRIELPASGMADAVIEILERESRSPDVVLLVSGDPGFYSLARRVIEYFGREKIRVIPGISSLQLMASRIGRPWSNVATVTLHGRDLPEISELRYKLSSSPALALLLGDRDYAPGHMRWLASDAEMGNAWAALGCDLGLPEERVFDAPSLRALIDVQHVGRLSLLWLEAGRGEI
ncbi:MAG: precorrin-6y C5,15-methyltransferase (decarboxylating) subunit CbiE [Synergistaceae bacterium]|jgi:precorrin-6y C5,15-methyltransferase (decarboxylating) CbiE subunit|nr:precorrin-6y C5,15-methyltransferase (decarboxylating) subunit CbiE [Synergistaceae bacterium]